MIFILNLKIIQRGDHWMIFFAFFCLMKPHIFSSLLLLCYMLSSEYEYSTSWNKFICVTGHCLALFKYYISNINIRPTLLVLLLFLLLLLLLMLGFSCILSIKCLYTWIFIFLSIFQVLHKHQQYKRIFFFFKVFYWKMLSARSYCWGLVYNLIKPI